MNHVVFIGKKYILNENKFILGYLVIFFLEMGVALGEHLFPLQVGHPWSALHIIKLVFSL